MGSKEQISNNYTTEIKEMYLDNPNPPDKRTAVIFGWAEGNIGDAIKEELMDAKFDVYGINQEICDVTDPTAVDSILTSFRSIDTAIFVNGRTHLDWIEDYPISELRRVIEDSLLGSMIGCQRFVAQTIDQPYKKHVVFIGSMAYKAVLNASSAYCAAKAGLAHFSRCMAWELAPKNYDVFTVHPSNTEGMPMTQQTIQEIMRYRDVDRATAEAYWSAILPKDRWLQATDIARTVGWLVSGEATYLSGTQVELAGGQR